MLQGSQTSELSVASTTRETGTRADQASFFRMIGWSVVGTTTKTPERLTF